MDKSTSISEVIKDEPALVKSVSDKSLDLLRPSSRFPFSVFRLMSEVVVIRICKPLRVEGQTVSWRGKDAAEYGKTKYTLIKDVEDYQPGVYDKPLPCFGCGVGWFSFLLGFLLPFMWFYATFLYFGNYYRKDPRERAGLAASAIAALGCSLLLFIILLIRLV